MCKEESKKVEKCRNCGIPRELADDWIENNITDKDGFCSNSCAAFKLGLL